MRRVALVGSLLTSAHAQTFVVDPANGPGTNFTDLPTAIATAPDGATLVVRPAFYSTRVTIDGKGLRVLCDPGVTFNHVVIRNTQPQQTVVLSRGAFLNNHTAGTTFVVDGAAGAVVLRGVVVWGSTLSGARPVRRPTRSWAPGWRASTRGSRSTRRARRRAPSP